MLKNQQGLTVREAATGQAAVAKPADGGGGTLHASPAAPTAPRTDLH